MPILFFSYKTSVMKNVVHKYSDRSMPLNGLTNSNPYGNLINIECSDDKTTATANIITHLLILLYSLFVKYFQFEIRYRIRMIRHIYLMSLIPHTVINSMWVIRNANWKIFGRIE